MKPHSITLGFMLFAVLAAAEADAAQTLSGGWASIGTVATGVSGTTTISFSVLTTPSSSISYVPGGFLNNGPNASSNTALWSDAGLGVSGHRSLQLVYTWDHTPEAETSPASDDGAMLVVTIGFSETVLNPIIHFDRVGGNGFTNFSDRFSNSSLWTLNTPGVTMMKLSGNSQFNVDENTIFRTPDVNLVPGTTAIDGEVNPFNDLTDGKGTGGGSVQFNGAVNSLTFTLTPLGVEGLGSDALELVFQTSPIPEPSIGKLSLLGVGFYLLRRRRRCR